MQATDRGQRRRQPANGYTKLYRVMYADDQCACLCRGVVIIENEFRRYGLILSRPKTESMAVNFEEITTKSESLFTFGETKIKNVLEFKY